MGAILGLRQDKKGQDGHKNDMKSLKVLKTCEKHEVARGKAGSFASLPYQLRNGATVQRPSCSRTLASTRGREVLMGPPAGHAAPAVLSAGFKLARAEQLRWSLCGDSPRCEIVALLASRLIAHWEVIPVPLSRTEIRRRVLPDESRAGTTPSLRGGISPDESPVLGASEGLTTKTHESGMKRPRPLPQWAKQRVLP